MSNWYIDSIIVVISLNNCLTCFLTMFGVFQRVLSESQRCAGFLKRLETGSKRLDRVWSEFRASLI